MVVGLLQLTYPIKTGTCNAQLHARNLALVDECASIASRKKDQRLCICLETQDMITRKDILGTQGFNLYCGILASYYDIATAACRRQNNLDFDVAVLMPLLGSVVPENIDTVYTTDKQSAHGKAIHTVILESGRGIEAADVASDLQPQNAAEYDVTCVGGTFDHLHNGHKVLLTVTAQTALDRLVIGISGDALLVNKKFAEQLEPYEHRVDVVRKFCAMVNHRAKCDIEELHDMYGPAVTDTGVKALVASAETAEGARKVAEERVKRGLNAIDCLYVSLVGVDNGTKLSSTDSRRRAQDAKKT